MADDEVHILADAAKLPMDDRVGHSHWKARAAAYDDMKAGIARVFDESDPLLATYGKMSKAHYLRFRNLRK